MHPVGECELPRLRIWDEQPLEVEVIQRRPQLDGITARLSKLAVAQE